MPLLRTGLLLALALLSLPTAARSGQLIAATWSGSFQGTPYLLTTGDGTLCACGLDEPGAARVEVPAQLFTLLDTSGVAPMFISQTLGGSVTISGNGANVGIPGRVNVFVGTNATTGLLVFTVPLTVGVTPSGGNPFAQITTLVPGFDIPVTVTASAFGWTTGTFTFASSTVSGVTIPTPFQAAGSSFLTPAGHGVVTLIAPAVTSVCAGGPFSSFPCGGQMQRSTTASVTSLTLVFGDDGEVCVPEPGVVLLLGAVLVAFAATQRPGADAKDNA